MLQMLFTKEFTVVDLCYSTANTIVLPMIKANA